MRGADLVRFVRALGHDTRMGVVAATPAFQASREAA